MKVFVTGSSSFVGRALLGHCKEKNIEAVGVDIVGDENGNNHICDVRSADVADLIPDRTDAVIHLAALSRDADCRNRVYDTFDVNVMGTLNLADAAKRKGVKQFIFASTEWVYDTYVEGEIKTESSAINASNHLSEYALSKYVCENALRQSFQYEECVGTILRLGIIYGPRANNWSAVESIFHSIYSQNEVIVGSLRNARRYIHVDDVASGVLSSLGRKKFETINLQGKKMISLADVIETGSLILGINPKVIEKSPNDFSIRGVSSEKAAQLLGWEAQIDLREGLESVLPFFD